MPEQPQQHFLLFGDQTVEKLPVVENIVRHSRTSPLLQRFLDRATDSLQIEASKLPKNERAHFVDFQSLLELAQRNNGLLLESSEVVATVILSIARLGELVLHAERDSTILGSPTAPTEILGFCTGGIPAAVAAAARDTEELLDLATESVGITLRLASELIRRSDTVDTVTKPWAITCVGVTPDEIQPILNSFHEAEVTPSNRRLSISIVGRGWFTIFGPPSTIERLCAWSSRIAQIPKVPTDARSSVHTTFLPALDTASILGESSLLNLAITAKARIISPFTTRPYEAHNFRELLQQVISDIAQNAMYVEKTIAHALEPHARKTISLSVMGKTQYLAYLEQALSEQNINYNAVRHETQCGLNGRSGSGAVAIVGMSGRFPGSQSVDELWNNLLAGKEFVTKIPESRFSLDEYYDPTHKKKNSTATCYGTFLDNPGMFDHKLFNMSPREAAQTDPLMRLLLTTSYEALEMAGYKPDTTLSTNRNRVNTYFGQVSDDWRDIVPHTEKGVDIYYVPGVSRSFAPSRLNYHFKWGGGSYSIDNACASSTTCVSLACAALLAKECDMALAGGGSILQSPYVYAGLSRAGMLSPTGGCKTFRADADGYCRGEGVGVVVLKRLEDAVADNDNIAAVIKGAARSYSNTATSMTHPSAEAQERLYRQVLRQSSISPDEISYLEMHGTGTQAGDFAEMSSVISAFTQGRMRDNPLAVGAIKANIGHGESAAGISSLIKTLMILRTYKIPPQPGMPFQLNLRFPNLISKNIYVASKGMMLRPKKNGAPLRVFVNSFDASGGNTCMALEEAPVKAAPSDDIRPSHVIVVTGKTKDALLNNRTRLRTYIKQHPQVKVADLAYTTTARRMHETLRICYTGNTTGDFIQRLGADIHPKNLQSNETTCKVTFVFTGQGSQYSGMGRDLFRTHTNFRKMIQAHERIAISQGLPSFLHLITEDSLDIASESPGSVQMALVSLEIAVAKLWLSWGIKPDLVIGHSLGEYAALCIAGILSVSDTLYLIGRRAALLDEKVSAGTYTMLVIRAGAIVVQELLAEVDFGSCQISLKNSPTMTVVSGLKADIKRLGEYLKALSFTTTLLALPYGFHSEQLDPILDDFEKLAGGAIFSEPKIPVASTLLAKVCEDAQTFSPKYLRNQMRQSVDFVGTLDAARTTGHVSDKTLYVEVGPHPICSSLIAATFGPSSRLLPSLKQTENAWTTISDSIASAYSHGCPVDWTEYHRLFSGSLSLLDLPTYAFDETNFWTPFNMSNPTQSDESREAAGEGPKIAGFPSSSLQKIAEWRIEGETVSASFISNTSDGDFAEVVNGHIVNGFAIIPAGLFGEMAMSAAQYVQLRLHPSKRLPSSHFSIHHLEIMKPIVLTENNASKDITTVVSHIQGSSMTTIRFEIPSDTGAATCGRCDVMVSYKSAEHAALSGSIFLIQSRIESLTQKALAGSAHQLSKLVIYRLFENLVKTGAKYRSIESAILGPDFRDASADVVLSSTSRTTSFGFQPYWTDALVQISGILLNCGLNHPDDTTFISNGLESWCFFEELRPDCKYTSYVQYQEMKSNSSIEGDVIVFCEDRLISHLRGVRFQMVKRATLTAMLSVGLIPSLSKTDLASVSSPEQPYELNGNELHRILDIIATESGSPVGDIGLETRFRDIGVDSLMAITIGAAVKDRLSLALSGTFFLDHDTVGEAIDALGLNTNFAKVPTILAAPEDDIPASQQPLYVPEINDSKDVSSYDSSTFSTTSDSSENNPTPGSDPPYTSLWTVVAMPDSSVSAPLERLHEQKAAPLTSKIVHLGGPRSASDVKNAFFFTADETGTIVRYMQLPGLGKNELPVYGVLSPFINDKADTEINLHDLATITATAIQKKQPYGPYRLGGYSVGGLIAYIIALQLLERGHEVESLILLDSPIPTSTTSLNTVSIEDLKSCGIIPGNSLSGQFISTIPGIQQEHVCRLMGSFLKISQPLLSKRHRPKKSLYVYAKYGLSQSGDGCDINVRSWVKSSWGSVARDAWRELIPDIEFHEVDGNHFNVMEYPIVDGLAPVLMEVLCKPV